jgi:hypothetical protein
VAFACLRKAVSDLTLEKLIALAKSPPCLDRQTLKDGPSQTFGFSTNRVRSCRNPDLCQNEGVA